MIDSYYKGALKGALVLGLILVLLPVVEWAIYHLVMRRRAPAVATPADPVVKFEPPADGPATQ